MFPCKWKCTTFRILSFTITCLQHLFFRKKLKITIAVLLVSTLDYLRLAFLQGISIVSFNLEKFHSVIWMKKFRPIFLFSYLLIVKFEYFKTSHSITAVTYLPDVVLILDVCGSIWGLVCRNLLEISMVFVSACFLALWWWEACTKWMSSWIK